jgi:hypothetical protein
LNSLPSVVWVTRFRMQRSPTTSGSPSMNGPVPIGLSENGGSNDGCRIAVG